MIGSFIAIGSGKGGVGKSTTTISIALSLALDGKKVAIVDLDPFSNIATILDIDPSAYQAQGEREERLASEAVTLADITLPYLNNCDILFPKSKSVRGSSKRIAYILFDKLRDELCRAYDLILLDMPAGIAEEFFIDIIPRVQHLVVVVLPEPTAHLSAAGFTKAVMQLNPAISIYFWHNKFRAENLANFNAYTVLENYNRYVDKPERFNDAEIARCRDVAHIPHEQMLDLLRVSFQPSECIWFRIRGVLAFFYELQVCALVQMVSKNSALNDYLTYHLLQNHLTKDSNIDQYLQEIMTELSVLRKTGILPANATMSAAAKNRFATQLRNFANYPFCNAVSECIAAIDQALRADKLSSDIARVRHLDLLEQRMALLLQAFDRYHRNIDSQNMGRSLRRCAVLLSIYLSFSKLLRHDTVRLFLVNYIPTRVERGRKVRDRRRQIMHLITRDSKLHTAHLSMIKRIYPIIIRQMMAVNTRYRLSTFNFILEKGKINARAYLQIVSQVAHEIIHCGLGVMIGISTSRTCAHTRRGSQKIYQCIASSE